MLGSAQLRNCQSTTRVRNAPAVALYDDRLPFEAQVVILECRLGCFEDQRYRSFKIPHGANSDAIRWGPAKRANLRMIFPLAYYGIRRKYCTLSVRCRGVGRHVACF